ncbi:MAG: aldehyde dehydrogenase (NADP(+)) [Planctomycetota bacterium]|nr:MAG: aldehyde dehydrogenase (NADP(+)) [Planctomycetota bacterium]
MITGRSIIAGKHVPKNAEHGTFRAFDPARGVEIERDFQPAGDAEVDAAAVAAWSAFAPFRALEPGRRAALLEDIAARLSALGQELVDVCSAETGLTTTRIISERERAVGVFRMFAREVRDGSWCRACIESGDSSRKPTPRPDLRRMLRPLGPVAVFGASNFPLAYSTAGGDTASALAAGCPVVVKGHPLHPGTGELVANAIAEAIAEAGLHAGTFSFLHSGGPREREIGARLVKNPCIQAVGFTGSLAGGTAIAEMGRDRPSPIPVYAEMGSTNPVFVLPDAAETKGQAIAERLVASVTNACGQMCTCPGLIFAIKSPRLEPFERTLIDGIDRVGAQVMLSPAILDRYERGLEQSREIEGVEQRAGSLGKRASVGDGPRPVKGVAAVLRTTASVFLKHPVLREEIFGPSTILVICANENELKQCASSIVGSLTGSIFATPYDGALAGQMQSILETRVGRLVYNGVPTGVEVNAAMVHGGPFPATTAPHTTAQGVLAMERWCRIICYQNTPDALLPPELRDANPLGIERMIDGVRTSQAFSRKTRAIEQ